MFAARYLRKCNEEGVFHCSIELNNQDASDNGVGILIATITVVLIANLCLFFELNNGLSVAISIVIPLGLTIGWMSLCVSQSRSAFKQNYKIEYPTG